MDILAAGPTRVMGVLNVTPDSFSDGGRWATLDAAVTQARRLVSAGADIIDVGGESTRPGAERPSSAEEARRVLPVVAALAAEGMVVSVDTMRSEIAAEAITAGAAIINDVSGGLADPEMLDAVAPSSAAYVAMHWRGHSFGMYHKARYDDVVGEVRDELAQRVGAAVEAGIARDRLVIDPGFGFAKNSEHNWTLLAGMHRIEEMGLPVLVGVSRKGFLDRQGLDPDPTDRDAATIAVTTLVAQRRVWAVRAHDVAAQARAISVVERLRQVRTP